MGDSTADSPALPRDLMAQRYQRLVLLNRMSIALFGDKPFAAALPEALHAAMALMGAQSVEVFFADELGQPVSFYRHSDKRLTGEAALAAERSLLKRALSERKIVASSDGLRSWEAAPLLRLAADAAGVTGGVVLGRVKAELLVRE